MTHHRIIGEIRKPFRTIVSCECGWVKLIFHRNAWARANLAKKACNAHLNRSKKK